MPRHMVRLLLLVLDREDLDPDVDHGLDPEHQDLGWIHPELPDVEARLAGQADGAFVDLGDVHQVLVVLRHTAEGDVPADPVAAVLAVARHGVEHALDAGMPLGVDALLHLAVFQPVPRLEPFDVQRQAADRRVVLVDIAGAPEIQLHEALEAAGGGVDRVDVGAGLDPHGRTVRHDVVAGHGRATSLHLSDAQVARAVGRETTTKTRAMSTAKATSPPKT